ncbi:N,N-dimethylformamidase beta subunit family domain-containing protein [Phycicoccus sp.]|uniref:N,N-dimethylformamidase beta subunit family domain-containing protein n=1 Tax=Phycicoccus sp. TaxID=1902410 RepID=UPI002BF0CA29|nr:N,N-dimethylformamidase beta subunit family domain-containing protein [Phycicoccus sp.]HMM94487.1 hypothetical protein [Phycicoccus sp.]
MALPVASLRIGAALSLVVLLTACTGSAPTIPVSGSATMGTRVGAVEPVAPRDLGFAPTLPGVVTPRCVNAPAGWLAAEQSRRAGVADLPDTVRAVRASRLAGVQGYLDRGYAACGERIGLHLSAPHPTSVVVEALRVGSYGGHSLRLVWRSPRLLVRQQPRLPATPHATVDNAWPVAVDLRPTGAWAPGLYLLELHPQVGVRGLRLPTTYQSLVVLSSGTPATYLAVESDLTQLAYDDAGGSSLYLGPGLTGRQQVASRRWFASPHRGLAGAGVTQLLARDVPLAVVLGHLGVTADWTTDTSLDADPAQLRGRVTVLLPGHSEYWTRRAYDALRAAVRSGTNLANLGGNEIYWQARVLRDAAGAVSEMVVYREAALDPVRDRASTTSEWRDAPLLRDPADLTGLGKGGVGITGSGVVVGAGTAVLAGTGLHQGQVLASVYGNEGDTLSDAHVPRDDVVLLRSDARTRSGSVAPLATVVHRDVGGAGVFDAGTTEWLCAITGSCSDGARTPAVRRALDTITANVLHALDHLRAGSALVA